MSTKAIYNNVPLYDVHTEQISGEVVKDSTGVDQLGVHYVVDFTTVVRVRDSGNDKQQTTLGVRLPGNTLATGLDALLDALTKDRRPFKMYIGASALFDVSPGACEPNAPPGTVTSDLEKMDLDHGPRPHVAILKITSNYSANIRFRVEFTLPNCGGGNAVNRTGLVNFRFWMGETVDTRTWLSTRTYMGRIRVAHKHISPMALRGVTVPALQRGFRREVAQVQESEDGLTLDFAFHDQEIYAAPPWSASAGVGATDWKGTFQTSTNDALSSYSELSFQLTGPKTTTKRDLFLIAMRIISSKTHYSELNASKQGQAFLEQFAVGEDLTENTLNFLIRIRHTGDKDTLLGLFGIGGPLEIGRPLGDLGIGYDPQVVFAPGSSATLAGLFLSTLQTPCAPNIMPKARGVTPQPYRTPRGSGRTPFQTSGEIPTSTAPVSPGQLAGMYLDAEIESNLIVNSGMLGLPTGAASDSKSSTMAFVNLHRATAMREIYMRASRVNLPPALPRPNTDFEDVNGIAHVQLGPASIMSAAPQLSADARKFLHRSEMKIVYGLDRPPGPNDYVPVGALPYRTSGPQDATRRLPPDVFVDPKVLLS